MEERTGVLAGGALDPAKIDADKCARGVHDYRPIYGGKRCARCGAQIAEPATDGLPACDGNCLTSTAIRGEHTDRCPQGFVQQAAKRAEDDIEFLKHIRNLLDMRIDGAAAPSTLTLTRASVERMLEIARRSDPSNRDLD